MTVGNDRSCALKLGHPTSRCGQSTDDDAQRDSDDGPDAHGDARLPRGQLPAREPEPPGG